MTFEEAGQHLSMALEAAVSRYGAMVRQVGRKYRLDDSDRRADLDWWAREELDLIRREAEAVLKQPAGPPRK